MRIIGVFGANGFIGRHLTRSLVARNHRVICFGRQFPYDFQVEFGDLLETRIIDLHDDLGTLAKMQGVTHVVQLINSSNPGLGNRRVSSDLQTNLLPHVQFMDTCITAGVQSFTFISSGGTVYGVPQTVPIPESHATHPLNSYGMTKLVTEQYLQMLCRGTDMGYNILRVANPYGPGQVGAGGQGLIGTILRQHHIGEPVTIFGDGRSERDYLYISDVIEAIVRSIESAPLNDIINVGSGVGRSISEVINAVELALGAPIARVHVDGRPTDVRSNVLDATKAGKLLGWRPHTDFEKGVANTVAWNLQRQLPR